MSDSPPKRDQQLGVMLTASEKEDVKRIAHELGMSLSNAGRYLIKKGLSVHDVNDDADEERHYR